jgi:hypothetical protein
LSNRDVRNICLDVLKLTKNYDRPDNFHSMNYREKSDFLTHQRKAVSGKDIASAIEKYAFEKEEQAKREFDEEVRRGLERVKVNAEIAKRAKEMGL